MPQANWHEGERTCQCGTSNVTFIISRAFCSGHLSWVMPCMRLLMFSHAEQPLLFFLEKAFCLAGGPLSLLLRVHMIWEGILLPSFHFTGTGDSDLSVYLTSWPWLQAGLRLGFLADHWERGTVFPLRIARFWMFASPQIHVLRF